MNESKMDELRSDMILRIRDAIRPDGKVTHETQQAVVEALCAVAGVIFLCRNHVPGNEERFSEVTASAVNGMIGWLEEWRLRN